MKYRVFLTNTEENRGGTEGYRRIPKNTVVYRVIFWYPSVVPRFSLVTPRYLSVLLQYSLVFLCDLSVLAPFGQNEQMETIKRQILHFELTRNSKHSTIVTETLPKEYRGITVGIPGFYHSILW